jgi:hypothetical protein
MPILRNAHRAIIEERKIRDYVLDRDHPRGGSKARVIAAATGLGRPHYADLIRQIRQGVLAHDAEATGEYDGRPLYRVDVTVAGPKGMMRLRTGWIYEVDEDAPRLTTAYPLR